MTWVKVGKNCVAVAFFCLAVLAPASQATQILLSTSGDAELGGLAFEDGDLVLFDMSTESAMLIFDEDSFRRDEDIDAVSVLGNGNILLSTRTEATLGGLTFRDGDLVEYDIVGNTASLYFDESAFAASAEVSAFDILPNGNLVLSTRGDAELGGLEFKDGDIVEYDPITDAAVLILDETLFTENADINAFDYLSNGNFLISTRKTATLGGLKFGDDDIVEYDPAADIATLFFDGGLFSSNYEDIDAVHLLDNPQALSILRANAVAVSEPGTLILLFVGLVGLSWVSRRKTPAVRMAVARALTTPMKGARSSCLSRMPRQ